MKKHLSPISRQFENFAKTQCQGNSPTYYRLAIHVAASESLLLIAAFCREGQPKPNLLFAAVQYVLFQSNHSLRECYPSCTDTPKSEILEIEFDRFVEAYREQIIQIIGEKLVQTNEVSRCAYLLPAINQMYEENLGLRLGIIEIGTSAGLNLLWDKYNYSYGGVLVEHRPSPILIALEHSNVPDRLLHICPSDSIDYRIGIDLNILDPCVPEDRLWLLSLIWPEHAQRRALLENACAIAEHFPIQRIEGDGIELLPKLVDRIPKGTLPVIIHTHTANQFSKNQRERFEVNMKYIATKRKLAHLFCEFVGNTPELHRYYYEGAQEFGGMLARCDAHGRSVEWM